MPDLTFYDGDELEFRIGSSGEFVEYLALNIGCGEFRKRGGTWES